MPAIDAFHAVPGGGTGYALSGHTRHGIQAALL